MIPQVAFGLLDDCAFERQEGIDVRRRCEHLWHATADAACGHLGEQELVLRLRAESIGVSDRDGAQANVRPNYQAIVKPTKIVERKQPAGFRFRVIPTLDVNRTAPVAVQEKTGRRTVTNMFRPRTACLLIEKESNRGTIGNVLAELVIACQEVAVTATAQGIAGRAVVRKPSTGKREIHFRVIDSELPSPSPQEDRLVWNHVRRYRKAPRTGNVPS
jgi:hypothetical protein